MNLIKGKKSGGISLQGVFNNISIVFETRSSGGPRSLMKIGRVHNAMPPDLGIVF